MNFSFTQRLSYRPFLKQTSARTRLSCDSFHQPSIHTSWPLGEIRRIMKRSCDPRVFNEAKLWLLSELTENYADVGTIERIHNTHFSTQRVRSQNNTVRFWLVLPFHPILYKASFQRAINVLLQEWSWPLGSALGYVPKVQVCWRNHYPSILANVRRLSCNR